MLTIKRLSLLGVLDLVREETAPSGLIRGLVDLTVLGGVGLIVLGVVAKEGGVCVIKLISKPAVCGVNVGFKCATGGVEHDTGVEGGAGVQMGYQKLMVLGLRNCNTGY